MRFVKNTSKRVLALVLTVLLLVSMLPVSSLSVFAVTDSALVTDIAEKEFFVDLATEFTYATVAGSEDAGKMVLGSFVVLDKNGNDARDSVKLLEYWDVTNSCYREFYGDFGPAATGFPLMDATSRFRVTFQDAGTYTVKASMINFADRSTLASAEDKQIVVKPQESQLITDIHTKTFFTNNEVDFTYTTEANMDKGEMVLGTFTVLDENGNDARSAVSSLKYLDVAAGEYREFYGDFGPATTGFPLADATSKFKVTFNQVGTYTVKAAMVRFADRSVLSSVEKTITVKPEKSELKTNLDEKTFINNHQVDFTYSTVANADVNTMVLGTFTISDEEGNDARSAVSSLKYLDVATNEYREFYGDFGPAATGFPLTDATSNFQVTFCKAGKYTVYAAMKKFEGGAVLCENTITINVQKEDSVLTTNIAEQTFEIAETVYFTYGTDANDDAETPVLGVFKLEKNGSDAQSSVQKLEYWDVLGNCYREFYGDFGPAATGFPLTDATSKFRVSFKESGTYTVTVQIVTFSGREVLCENVTVIEVKDTQPPVISNVTGNPETWVSGSAILEVLATDNSGSIAQYRVNEEDWQSSNQFEITENGTYVFYAKDAAGNVSAVSQEVVVDKLDNECPEVGVITLDPDDWTKNAVTFTVPATDAGVGEVLYNMDDARDENGDLIWQTENTFKISDNLEHVIYVKDSLGNTIATPVTIVADKYDNKPPVIESLTPDTTEWVNHSVYVTVVATDEGIKLLSYSLTGNENEWQQSNIIEIPENGTYYVYVQDGLENVVDTPAKIIIENIDKTLPAVQNLTATTTEWTNLDSVIISGNVFDGESGVVKLEYRINDGEWTEYTYQEDETFTITENREGVYTYEFRCYDKAENISQEKEITVKIDRTKPTQDVAADITEWTNQNVVVSGTVDDNLSNVVKVEIRKDGETDWTPVDVFTAETKAYSHTIAAQDYKGEYFVRCEDAAGNTSESVAVDVQMDISKPEFKEILANPDVWTNQNVVVSGTVDDNLSDVVKVEIRKDGETDWRSVDVFTAETKAYSHTIAAQDYEGKYFVRCKDAAGNEFIDSVDVYMDTTYPTDLTITYDIPVWKKLAGVLFGFKNTTVNVVLSAKDVLSGVDYIEYSLNGESYTKIEYNGEKEITYNELNIETGYRDKISFRVTDQAGNTKEYSYAEETTIVVDFDHPKMLNSEVKYTFTDGQSVKANDIYYTQGDVNIQFVIQEANFDLSLETAEDEDAAPVPVAIVKNLLTDEKTVQDIEWTQLPGTDKWIGSIDIIGEGDYMVTVNFTDRAGNPMDTYQQKIHIDKTNPVIKPYAFTQGEVKNTNEGRVYYQESQALTIQVVEHNFDPARVDLTVEAKNYAGDTIVISPKNYYEFAKNPANWVQDADNKDLYTLVLSSENGMLFDVQANYTVKLTVEDYAELSTAADDVLFTIDWTAPEQPVITYSKKAVLKVIEDLTFGFYQAPVTITITTSDVISGVKEIAYSYDGTVGMYDLEKVAGGNTIQTTGEISYTVEDGHPFCGEITATAYDWSANESDVQTVGKDAENQEMNSIVLDNTDPQREVILSTPNRVVHNETLMDFAGYKPNAEGDKNATLYYNDAATVTFRITEANFFPEDYHVFVNGVETNPTDWTVDENSVAIGTITIAEEGDYVVTMTGADKSGNPMENYKSNRIVIDHTEPEISVSYSGEETEPKYTKDGRLFYRNDRIATIRIKEHNFRASEVCVNVMAKDICNNNVTEGTFTFDENGNIVDGQFTYNQTGILVDQYIDFARISTRWTNYEENWRREDNEFVIEIPFSAEANYTFDVAYTDLAGKEADDYAEDQFTIDNSEPKQVFITYGDPVTRSTESNELVEQLETALGLGIFYYKDLVDVTITAVDNISGVYGFTFSGELHDDVSNVNVALTERTVNETDEGVTITQGENEKANLFSYTFQIPAQFNGFIKFQANDRSQNNTKAVIQGGTTTVVDNIAPTLKLTPSQHVTEANNVLYYDGAITMTIEVEEANFFSEDVKIEIIKDNGNPYTPNNVSWRANGGDVYIGTFTINEGDGDYVVKASYTDRSDNSGTAEPTKQLTIDTKDPVIRLEGIKHESANNGETIGFVLTVTDTNIPLANITPKFTVEVKTDKGGNLFDFGTVTLDLGTPTVSTNANGETVYTYTVENLDTDGYYTLTCEATDYAAHKVTAIQNATVSEAAIAPDVVNFSVNREGSIFWIETVHTDKYTGETLNNQLNSAYANDNIEIRLYEINVDPVDIEGGKGTVFTVNDGSQVEDIILEEGVNYTKNVSVGTGGWYKTEYVLENNVFNHDGDYSLSVITYDKANNSNVNTKSEAGTIRFTLDRTNPVISANVTSKQRIDATEYWVQFEIAETNLDASTIEVKLVNKKGVAVETQLESLGNNMYKFHVGSGLRYDIEISAKDYAGNEAEVCRIDDLTISDNFLVLWYANTPVFWGSIGGAVLLAGLIILLIVLKKKKNK